jgi:hypothetical protein
MALGVITPIARLTEFELGVVAPGATLLTQLSGTTTNTPVYTDPTMGTALSNPVVADSVGRFPSIFLNPALTYRFTLADSLGVTIWGPVDGIAVSDSSTVNTVTAAAIAAAVAAATTPAVQIPPAGIVGAQNNFALTASPTPGLTILRMNNPSAVTFSGFTPGIDGQRLIVESVGAGQVNLIHESALSTAAWRLFNFAVSGPTSLAPSVGRAEFMYDTSAQRWVLISHEQGAWISPAFSAVNFTASASMVWTVDAGDLATCRYFLRGRTLQLQVKALTTSISGSVSTGLFLSNGAYGGFTSALAAVKMPGAMVNDNAGGVLAGAYVDVSGNSTFVTISKLTNANYTLSTNLTDVYVSTFFEVL